MLVSTMVWFMYMTQNGVCVYSGVFYIYVFMYVFIYPVIRPLYL